MSAELNSGPLVLLATIWLSAAPVMAANKQLHEQRDIVMGITNLTHLSSERSLAVKSASLYHSYIPILIGILFFLMMMAGVIWVAAQMILLPDDGLRWMCSAVAVMPALMFVGFLIGGVQDIFSMRRILEEDEQKIKEENESPQPALEVDSFINGV